MRFSAIFLLSCPSGKRHPQAYHEGLEQMRAAEVSRRRDDNRHPGVTFRLPPLLYLVSA